MALGAVFVVIVGSVVVAFHDDKPKVTWKGQSIDHASVPLDAAESAMRKEASARHGVVAKSSRCYFVQKDLPTGGSSSTSTSTASDSGSSGSSSGGAVASDVQDYARCGPVLFIDGDPKSPWLSYDLTPSTKDGKTVLTAATSPQSNVPETLHADEKLVRPDGRKAPSDAAGLKPPPPPPAATDYLQLGAADAAAPPKLASPVVMEGWTIGVEVTNAGIVAKAGHGDDTRSAAPGYELVAANMVTLDGEFGDGQGDSQLGPSFGHSGMAIVVDGQTRGLPQPDTGMRDGRVLVVSVPKTAKSVQLVFIDNGVVQKIGLLDGKGDPGNPAVLTRQRTSQDGNATGQVGITLSKPGYYPLDVLANVTVHSARLTWFGGINADKHPSAPDKAYLRVLLDFSWSDNSKGQLDSPLLSLRLPDGTVVPGIDLEPDPQLVWTAFEVPANFTTGTITFGGSITVPGSDVTESAHSTANLAVTVPSP